jgi:nitrogen fixation/metabolism regulation signal transduction histidine kinase
MSVVSTPPQSGVLLEGGEREFAREMQADNDELRESNRQLIAALEEIQSLNVTLQSVNEALHSTNVELRAELDVVRSRVGDLEHMLNGIGVAAVLLSEELEVRDYNAAASRFLSLRKQDIGRTIARVRHDFVQTSLADLCREALDSGEPLERVANANAGELVSLRIREVELGASVTGLLLTITEISDLCLDPQSNIA